MTCLHVLSPLDRKLVSVPYYVLPVLTSVLYLPMGVEVQFADTLRLFMQININIPYIKLVLKIWSPSNLWALNDKN